MDTNEIIEANTRKKKKSNILFLSIVIVIVVVLTVVLMKVISKFNRDFVYSLYNTDDYTTSIYLNGALIDTIDSKAEVYENMDGSACYIQSGKESFYIKDGKLEPVVDGLKVYKLANHANIALAMDDDSHLYLLKDNKAEKITSEPVDHAVISGDGKNYAYNIGENAYFGERPGKETKAENVLITYMSDDGKLIYGLEYATNVLMEFKARFDEQLFSEDDKSAFYEEYKLVMVENNGKIIEAKDGVESLLGLNSTGNELMFVADDKTYILRNGTECIEVYPGVLYNYRMHFKENDDTLGYGYRNIDSYEGTVIKVGNILYQLTGNFNKVEIVSNCSTILGFSEELSKVLYLSDYKGLKTLCLADVKKGAKYREIEKEVDAGVISPDGEDIYYYYYDMDERQRCLRYVKGNSESETIFWVPVGNIHSPSLEVVGDEIYANMGEIYYIKKKDVVQVEALTKDFEYVVDECNKEEYVAFEHRLYKLDKVQVKDEDNKKVQKLEKKELSTKDKIKKIEKLFKVDLPNDAELRNYEDLGDDNVVARFEIKEEDYQDLVAQYEGVQFDMLKYAGDKEDIFIYMPNSCRFNISEIEHWYQVDSTYDEGDILPEDFEDFEDFDFLLEVRKAKNVFICGVEKGKFIVVFGSDYDQPVAY